jgi:site-specific DNA-methyltransferase (adenine-specific)
MEDIWFATNNGRWVFNLYDVKVRKKVIAPYKQDGKPKDWQETENGSFRDTCPSNSGTISQFLTGQCQKIQHTRLKNPKNFIAKLILASSNKGDVVFDPFLGSGTTSVTAKN